MIELKINDSVTLNITEPSELFDKIKLEIAKSSDELSKEVINSLTKKVANKDATISELHAEIDLLREGL